jgi:hypothetical protein
LKKLHSIPSMAPAATVGRNSGNFGHGREREVGEKKEQREGGFDSMPYPQRRCILEIWAALVWGHGSVGAALGKVRRGKRRGCEGGNAHKGGGAAAAMQQGHGGAWTGMTHRMQKHGSILWWPAAQRSSARRAGSDGVLGWRRCTGEGAVPGFSGAPGCACCTGIGSRGGMQEAM